MDDCKASAKKSLMNSLENLNHKASVLEDVSNLSWRLLKKFTNPIPEPEHGDKIAGSGCETLSKQPDLIDLFNSTASNIDRSINIIGKNLEQILSMVE